MTTEENKAAEASGVVEEKLEPEKKTETEKSVLSSLLSDYAEKVKTSGDAVRTKFLDLLVNRELDDRVALLDNALKKRVDLEKDVKKRSKTGDVKIRNGQGEIVQEGFTESKYEELKEARNKLKKLDDAIELALSGNDYSKLKESK